MDRHHGFAACWKRLAAGLSAVLGLLLVAAPSMAIEEPAYELIEQSDAFELRDYPAVLVAETEVEASFQRAGNAAFGRLFRYISGANIGQVEIAMTAPVTQAAGEKIEMTAPVTQQAAAGTQRVAFVMPARFTASTVPKPTDERVVIREWPARRVAVWRYGGRWTEQNYDEALVRLDAELATRGLVAIGAPTLARYDPPFKPWFMRRNEVWIPVDPGVE